VSDALLRADDLADDAAQPAQESEPPLVVDVDGTLIKTDLLQEATLQFVARHPTELFRLLPWLASGKARLKSELADRIDPRIDLIPFREETVERIRAAQAEGRRVFLASASDRRYVETLAARVGGIAGVFATSEGVNLSGAKKAAVLEAAFGKGGFDYIGDNPVDFPVWRSARKALVVAHSGGFAKRVQRAFPGAEVVTQVKAQPRSYIRAMRPHQWAKNALLFLPAIAAHRFDLPTIGAALLAFFCFSFAASSAYIVNDLLDLPGDRDHPRKRRRPFAAGDVPVVSGIALGITLMLAAVLGSLLLPNRFIAVLAAYVVMTLAYSFVLKRRLLIDVITLGGLYTLRVFAGLAALQLADSPWLLMFSLFLFLSLAVVKRCSELVLRRDAGKTDTVGRGYRTTDLAVLFPLGAAAGYGAVFVIALYLSSPDVAKLYMHPTRMWLICPLLLYWVSRVLILTSRGDVDDDPLIFALKDRISWVTGLCVAGVIAISI
jgi:4-hydroxybenzoate polyprenyltransferase/phosphoserine phosphatase